jgi:DNA-binding NtrC family response regulator
VLVADDDVEVRDLITEFCREQGLLVTIARDGRAAVSELERAGDAYDVIFTDVAMPGADGFAVLSAARAAHPAVYVVIITGYASLESAIEAVRAGANDYLAKPFSLGQIDVALARARERLALTGRVDTRTRFDALEKRLHAIEQTLERIEFELTRLKL